MSELFLSPWIPEFVLVLLAGTARALRGSWLSPAALVALIWAFYIAGCLLLTDYQIFPGGIWIIVLFVFSVQFGATLAEGAVKIHQSQTEARRLDLETVELWSRRSFLFTVLFAAVALIGMIHLLLYSFEKYSLGFSLLSLLSLGHLWSVARYQNGELEPWSVRLLIMWVYPAALLAGICFATARRRLHKYASFMPLLPATLIGSVFAERAGLAFAVVCWLSGFFAVRYYETRGAYALFQRKLVIVMLSLVAGGLLFFVTIDTLRIFEGGDNVELRLDTPRISKYLFGSVPAFCSWFHYMHPEEPGWGALTFSGVFDLLGIKQREIGVYVDHVTLMGGEETNIYTMFRGLIEDFTLTGMCCFGILLGVVSGYASRLRQLGAILTLSGCYALLLFSPLISLFAYNGLILAWVVSALLLGWRRRPRTFEAEALA
ncbi:MAG TPA: O-antigen polymerase [Verrucomicrobiae bacterium]|nr:O-antigen polymerase [Verrucomicrobiae bacterium]